MINISSDKNFEIAHLSSGNFVTGPGWRHVTRNINSYEVIYVLYGEVFIEEDGTQYSLKKDSVLILHPGRIHSGFKESEVDTSFFWLHFNISDYRALGITRQYFPSTNGNLSELFKNLLHVVNSDNYPKYTQDLLSTLIISEIFILQDQALSKSNKIVNEISEWVRINIEQPITLESVAQHFQYSPNHLSAIFKKTKGIGIKEYINKTKINYAKQLLLTTNYSIKQIAAMLNFSYQNQFINYFKYHENISPSKYKNLYFNTHYNNDQEYRLKSYQEDE